jgi:hypothetical protein
MSRRVQTAVLAVAALGSLAFAGVRIGHAARSSSVLQWQVPVYGSTPAAEAATLKALRVPPAFHRAERCTEGECFVLRRSLPLDVATSDQVAEDFGVKVASTFAARRAVECGVIVHSVCHVEGIVGGEYVAVWLHRPEVRTHERRSGRTVSRFRVMQGTEVEVSVLGRCLHPKQCKEEKRQEATEARSGK